MINNWLWNCNSLWNNDWLWNNNWLRNNNWLLNSCYRSWYSKGLLLDSDSLLNRLDVLLLNVRLLCNNWCSLYNRSGCLKCLLLNLLNSILDIILTSDSLIFNSFCNSFNWHIFNYFFLNNIRNIFCFILNGLIFCNLTSDWDLNLSSNFFIFCDCLFIRNIFNSRLTSHSLTSLNNI